MNKNFINFRTGLVKLPVIIAGVFFLSHPTVTHASENNASTESNAAVAHDENHTTNESNNIENKDNSTSANEATNSAEESKEADSNATASKANSEPTVTPSENSATDNNTATQPAAAKPTTPALTPEEEDAYFTDPNFRYDTSKDPHFKENGALKDTRVKLDKVNVRNRTAYIYVENGNYTGQIENLKHASGTGSVIGENYILTAGHVIYSNNYPRGYLTGGYVSPGRHEGTEKFGRYKIKAMHVMPQYMESPLQRYDIGIIEVEPHEDMPESIAEISPYNIKPFKKEMLGKKIESQGYPIDKNEESIDQYWVDGTIIQKQPKGTVELSMYGYSGQSGSPIILEGTDEVIGVFTYDITGNKYGTLMTPITHEIYNWIQSIINKDAKVEQPTTPAEQPKVDDTAKPAEQPKVEEPTTPAEQPKADDTAKPAEQPKADEPTTPAEQPKVDEPTTPIEQPKADEPATPAEQPKADDTTTPAEQPKADEPAKPVEQPKVDEPTTPAEQPKADEPTTPAEQPKVDEPAQPAEQPKADDTAKPAEQPKVDESKQAVKATQINNTDKAVTATQVSTSHAQNKAQSNAKHDEKQLPKTGENEAITTTLFGTLFAMLGSLLFFRKRKTDK
ncbi:trypsin-like serine protease [Mammaliicoccus sciuri]|uniref:trypsin-like serine protease n=1 Tax=Mammaliicoccus sciuri TaxID=1296 RepID=UPI0021D20F38|nr:trypsin-like serine protease [Mammaliicoccus sciuri]UXU84007.1 trypsin-like serine protease [Mammaliicoccus sciuri]UXU93854.1 trypsin-like serine protease [Mammaliicoccus sciuri]UXV15804.1 trypsin-like serine protease [Mammaliicoccus sciuri]UXV24064.1 trypsin-like serine protease [Mammaliicoccus sciuri]UXV26847.1 trypsin-like serine protease [Mammaliicoccus sciuri]